MISKVDKGGIFGSEAKLKADTIREANEFAAKQGKIVIPIWMNGTPMYIGHFASFEYQFRVVSKDDPEAQRTSMIPRPDVVIEKHETLTSVDATPPQPKAAANQPEVSAPIDIESSVPNADVYVDGKFVGNAPLPNYRLPIGTHVVEVRADGYISWKRELTVVSGGQTRIVATLQRSGS
jgi:hypothetical protein